MWNLQCRAGDRVRCRIVGVVLGCMVYVSNGVATLILCRRVGEGHIFFHDCDVFLRSVSGNAGQTQVDVGIPPLPRFERWKD